MPRYFLTRLKIEGFRGINNEKDPLELKFKGDTVNSIFAVNGIGKSSLFDALCYAVHGEIPKLEALQAAERPQDYYCNRFHSAGKAAIDLEFQPDDGSAAVTIHVERDSAGKRTTTSPSGHADPEAFLKSLKERFALLDYRTFARFIEDSALDRGRTFSSLLGLSDYSDRRQALQTLSDTRNLNADLEIKVLTTSIATANKAAVQALTTLRTSYEKVTGKSLDDIDRLDEYAVEVSDALAAVEMLKPLLTGKKLDEIDFDDIKSAIRSEESGEKRKELEQAVAKIASVQKLVALHTDYLATEQAALKVLLEDRDTLLAATPGDLFKRLFDTVGALIEDGTWPHDDKCPLCESGLAHSLKAHVDAQLAQYAATAQKLEDIATAWQASSWRTFIATLEGSGAMGIAAKDRRLNAIGTAFDAGGISIADFDAAVAWSKDLKAKADTALVDAQKRKGELEAELPESLVQLTEQVEYGRNFKEALAVYKEKKLEEAAHQAKLDIREKWKAFVTAASIAFSDAEAALSKAKIKDIETEYQSMFKDIMYVGDVVPELQRDENRENLHVQLSEFHGQKKLSATALLSESYRNALAISVFLAAAMKHTGVPRFVVLDDVTSSFDAGHQFGLMELLRSKLRYPANAQGLQFIILSHDGLLEKYFDRHGNTAEWTHNKLQGSPPMGAVLNQSQGVDRLKKNIDALLAAGQTAQAEPLIRQYLEFKLQQVIRKLDIPVPIDFAMKDANQMVQNCLDAINDVVKLHQAANQLILEAKQVSDLTTVHLPSIVGNWVSHYATGSGSSFSAAALQKVVQTIDDLAGCFQYDANPGGNPDMRWYRSLSRKT